MNIGISQYCIPKNSIEKLVHFAQENNFESIELWDTDELNNKEIMKLLLNSKLETSLHANPNINFGDSAATQNNIDILKKIIKKALILRADTIVIHGGHGGSLESFYLVIDNVFKLLEDNKISICIENTGYIEDELFHRTSLILKIIKRYNSEFVRLTFDVAHANLTNEINYISKNANDYVHHIHISNNFGDIEKHHLPLTEGTINFLFLKLFYGRRIIIEIEPSIDWSKNLIQAKKFITKLMG